MREIEFRGKRLSDGEWIYGSYIYAHKYYWDGMAGYLITNIYGENKTPCDGKTIGQYTGLQDTNGKKIYEGDILDFTYQFGKYPPEKYCGVVEFGNPNGFYDWGWGIRFIGKEKPSNTDTLLWIEMPDVECLVIGNIHENPELLKKE